MPAPKNHEYPSDHYDPHSTVQIEAIEGVKDTNIEKQHTAFPTKTIRKDKQDRPGSRTKYDLKIH